MDFDSIICPLSRSEFLDRYRDRVCFVVRGYPEKFSRLLSLEDIERRLNDGCNLNSPINIISSDGSRRPYVSGKVSWSSMAVRKQDVLRELKTGHSFMMTNLSQINDRVARLLDSIEDALSFDNLHGDLHLYVSTTKGASAYNAHRDYPQHKIYLQVTGSTQWIVYHHDPALPGDIRSVSPRDEDTHLEEAGRFVLDPGDLFYMPPAVFHKVVNADGPRISCSLPLSPGEDRARMDRTYIPFTELFSHGFLKPDSREDAA